MQDFLDEMQRELLDSRVHSYLELYVPALLLDHSAHRSEETLGMPELTTIQVRCLWSKTGRIIGIAGLGLLQHCKPEEEHEKQKQCRDLELWPGRRVTTFDTQIICLFPLDLLETMFALDHSVRRHEAFRLYQAPDPLSR